MKTAIIILALMGVALASVVKRQALFVPLPPPTPAPILPPRPAPYTPPPQATTYHLPSGAELIVGQIRSTFSCIDKIYGYYADVDNNCQIFHVCVPFVDEYNVQQPITYSFFCGNQTVFDQLHLTCHNFNDATPCSEAVSLYRVNEDFGKTDRPSLYNYVRQ